MPIIFWSQFTMSKEDCSWRILRRKESSSSTKFFRFWCDWIRDSLKGWRQEFRNCCSPMYVQCVENLLRKFWLVGNSLWFVATRSSKPIFEYENGLTRLNIHSWLPNISEASRLFNEGTHKNPKEWVVPQRGNAKRRKAAVQNRQVEYQRWYW